MQLSRGFITSEPSGPPPAESSTSTNKKKAASSRHASGRRSASHPPGSAPGLASLIAGSAMLAVPVLAAFLAVRALAPPAPLPADALPAEFSARRAAAFLSDVAAVPHPMGTRAHDAVRDVVLRDWRTLGLEPIIQSGTYVDGERHYAARVENILVRLSGTNPAPGRALLLATHYDSEETAPGAADDGSGIATLLETARALLAGPRLAGDVIFLITDGEEDGLIGASVFCEQHPWAKDVALALNFETRGTSGPSLMFQTSPGNSRLIEALAATPHPRGYSLAQSVYERMPNYTDLTEFLAAKMQGMGFAFIGHPLDYHTPNDNLTNLDLGSLQQDGSYALALARRFGDGGIPDRAPADAVYFSLFGDIFVHYPSRVALVIACLAATLVTGAITAGTIRRRIRVRGLLFGIVFFIGSLAAGAGLGYGFVAAVKASHGSWLPAGPFASNPFYALALAALGAAAAVLVYGLVRAPRRGRVYAMPVSRASGLEVACGAGVVWSVLAIATAVALPEGSYIVGVPVLVLAATAFLWAMRRNRIGAANRWKGTRGRANGEELNWREPLESDREPRDSEPGIAASLPAAVIIVLIATPVIYLVFIAMFLSPEVAAILAAVSAFMVTAATPAMETIRMRLGKSLAAVLLLLFVAGAVAGAVTSRYTDRDPRWVSLSYLLDFDKGRGYWIASARDVVPLTKEIAGGDFTKGHPQPEFAGKPDAFAFREAPVLAGPAGAPPQVRVLEDRVEGVSRTLRLRISSPRGGRHFVVQCTGEGITSAAIEGRPLVLRAGNGKGFAFAFMNPGREGFDLSMKARAAAVPVIVKVRESNPGLPDLPGFSVPPPPPGVRLLRTSVDISVSASISAQANATR